MKTPGTLFVVATPIGNLEDLSARAIRILGEVTLIAAEDTRQTRKLLSHFAIRTPMTAYHEHNEARQVPRIIELLKEGKSIALVSDAGTPGISDPGYRLVRACRRVELPCVPIPGPSAVIAALSASGLPTDQFHFGGFLPIKAGRKRQLLETLGTLRATLIFYESPYRLQKTMSLIADLFPDREVVIARELTKRYEEFLQGSATDLLQDIKGRTLKGELVILLAGRVREASKKKAFPTGGPQSPGYRRR